MDEKLPRDFAAQQNTRSQKRRGIATPFALGQQPRCQLMRAVKPCRKLLVAIRRCACLGRVADCGFWGFW